MPASNTPKLMSCRMLARDRGTPQWLLWDLSDTCTGPDGASASFSASLVPVLPTLPVTAITTASLARARPAMPRSFSACDVSEARISRFSPRGALKSCSTMAHEAPCDRAASTKRCPSRFSPRSATKASSGARLRLSMETPLTGVVDGSALLPCTDFTISPTVHRNLGTLSPSFQCGFNRVVVRIGNDGALDDLSRLVSLAGNQQHIPLLQIGDRLRHSGRTPGNLDSAGRRSQYLPADVGGLLAPRIVVGDDGKVRSIHRNRAHLGALALVAITSATEYDREAIAHVRPECVERFGQRVRRMRIVDEDGCAGAGGAGEIEASSCAAQVCKQWKYLPGVRMRRQAEPGGNEGVGRLKGADQRKPQSLGATGMKHDKPLAETVLLSGEKLQGFSRTPDGNDRKAPPTGNLHHLRRARTVDVDHSHGPWLKQFAEQAQLFIEIGLEAWMVIEVVARNIGEGTRGKPQTIDAALLEPVARCFEREMRNAGFRKLGKDAMQLDRIWCGVGKSLRA